LEIRREWLSENVRSKLSLQQRRYRLNAVIWHDGKEATKGHYVADVFHPAWCGWLRHDDGNVEPVQESVLFSAPPANPTRVPYLLIYRRQDTFASTNKPAAAAGGAKGQMTSS
jgi:ubiquitin C-terminal hydrolase